MEVKRTERGWPGHFCLSPRCLFRRNTLVECGEKRVVVSTVGSLVRDDRVVEIAPGRYYETMAFVAKKQGEYWDGDLSEGFNFESKWSITGNSIDDLSYGVDNEANEMHEGVVQEIADILEAEALANEI